MSNFLKIFRSKKPSEKENLKADNAEEKVIHRSKDNYGGASSSKRDKRISRIRSIDDSFMKATAAYHTVTQPRQYKVSRSCVGRDEYDKCDKFRHSVDLHNRNSMKYGKRSYLEKDRYNERMLLMGRNNYDSEVFDSDDSYDSQNEVGRNSDNAVHALEMKLDGLFYRLRREEERKNAYKQKLMSERIVRQHVESKFVEDIQRLTQLVETLKNEQKSYRNRIMILENQIKQSGLKLVADSLKGSSLFCSPPSTSNAQVLAINDLACSATSGSTVPLASTLHCNAINEESIDEVRNFRINEVSYYEIVTSSVEAERRTISGSSFSTHENEGSPTLEETLRTIDRATKAAAVSHQGFPDKISASKLRRSSSDTRLGHRDMMLKSTNI
ncbi:unnamed protein product [Thelazia callipaeda]|uniref:Uncharacterized protein n=1 Tax=Thelazia callipaeda TaxID=103827 RepID=A0A0N5D478_THECL|nr:unnamed protein product [Thelazia callipaeda]